MDGDMIRGHAKEFQLDCGVSSQQKPEESSDYASSALDLDTDDTERLNICQGAKRWSPRRNTTFARQMCAATGLARLDRVQIFRYVAQHVAPIQGFEEAKRKCRKLWGSKVALAVHVRRTDKVLHEDKAYKVTDYVDTAIRKGWKFDVVHIVTDDPTGVGQEMHCQEFSMAESAKRFDCTTLKRGKESLKRLENGGNATASFLGLVEDVACLAEADFLVGSRRSNIPWLAQTLRNKAPETAIGLGDEALAMP